MSGLMCRFRFDRTNPPINCHRQYNVIGFIPTTTSGKLQRFQPFQSMTATNPASRIVTQPALKRVQEGVQIRLMTGQRPPA